MLLFTFARGWAQEIAEGGDGGPQQQGQVQAGQLGSGAVSTVRGTVVNSVTGQPIARALVLLDQYGVATLSDNEGRFSFSGVPAGTTMLSARRPGFSSGNGSRGRVSLGIVVGAPGGRDVTLALTPESTITGELTLPGDDSPDEIQVQLLHQEIQNGRARWATYGSTETNSQGRFRFGNLPAGAYLVHAAASPDPAPAESTKVRMGYVPLFYPSAREIAGAGVVTLSAGQQADVRMALVREPYYPVVLPVTGDASRGIGFVVASDSFLGLSARYSPQDGMVHMELPSGHYLVEGTSFGPSQVAGQREFDVNGAPLRGPAIALTPVNRIPVTVRADLTHLNAAQNTAGGGGPGGGDGGVLTAANQVSLDLQKDGNGAGTHGGRPSLQDDSGSSRSGASYLVGVTPGRYWVNAHAFNGYVAAMTSGGVDLLEEPFVVNADGSASPIEVTIRDDTASLSATLGSSLQQGLGASGSQQARGTIFLHLIPQTGAAVERTEPFGADGSVQMSNLAPGSYLAFASTERQELAYRDPRVLATLAGKTQTLTLEPGGTERIAVDALTNAQNGTAAGGAQ